MFILRIDHSVQDFASWKRSFDSDPVGRERSGVRRYRISRPIDDANFVTVDLEFDTVSQAQTLLAALHAVWSRVEGTVIMKPQGRVIEAVEIKEL